MFPAQIDDSFLVIAVIWAHEKPGSLLRSGMIPMAYVYPQKMRATRDLLRRRMHFMRKKNELLSHIQNTKNQYSLPDFKKTITRKNNRKEVAKHFIDPIMCRQ